MRRFFVLLIASIILAVLLIIAWPFLGHFLSSQSPTVTVTIPPEPADEACPGNVLINGSFEQGGEGWLFSGSEHGQAIPALRFLDENAGAYRGKYSAMLGGFETASDNLSQSFLVPERGVLSLWWYYRSPDPIKDRDTMLGRLVLPTGEDALPVFYAGGDVPQETWQQTSLDLADYAGQRLTLEFSTYNDNYYAGWLAIDEICLQSKP
jgi:hypothetical protein